MRVNHRLRILLNYVLVFLAFGIIIVVFQMRHESRLRNNALSDQMALGTYIINRAIEDTLCAPVRIHTLVPDYMRVTVIDRSGQVLFDNVGDRVSMENHQDRPEIREAWQKGKGRSIRESETTGERYYYYAEQYGQHTIRVAMPYAQAHALTRVTGNLFILVILVLFVIGVVLVIISTGRMDRDLARLKEFMRRVNAGERYTTLEMPDTGLGNLGKSMIKTYQLLEESNERTQLEREKLLHHFMHASEGVALFDQDRNLLYSNTYFIQYVNMIRDEPVVQLENVLGFEEFARVIPFLDSTPSEPHMHNIPTLEYQLIQDSYVFLARVLLFPDGSFEISLQDVSQQEENHIMKQQMTSNIAHELRTPVSSIRGYIETLLRNGNVDQEQQRRILSKAFDQCERLSQLIESIQLITEESEPGKLDRPEPVNLHDLFDEALVELRGLAQEQQVQVENALPDDLIVQGERQSLYAMWRNLLENSLQYAGPKVTIRTELSTRDARYVYIKYYDTGVGVSEEHLSRIFERFYRVDAGRTRTVGGTGLGLAIVKNAVTKHSGQIRAKLHKPQGLEFIITLSLGKAPEGEEA